MAKRCSAAGACCAGQDIYDAKTVADRLGIAHYVLDYESRFRTGVIDRFADEYARGRTPVPCALCNQGVKFTDLIAFARELGADCLATGHYVRRVVERRTGPSCTRAPIRRRDQSYFLYGTTRDQLDFLRFPLGDLPKSEVRELAAEAGLEVAAKPDSQDICFVPDGDYAGLVKKLRPETAAPGEIVDLDGRVLGQHRGVVHFTVGQRRGIEIGGQAEPLYVVRIEPEQRRLVVGPRRALAVEAMRVEDLNWLGEDQREVERQGPLAGAAGAGARSTATGCASTAPEYGVAPGQAAVFYDGSRLLGGGWIAETAAASLDEPCPSSRPRRAAAPTADSAASVVQALPVGLGRRPGADQDADRADQPMPRRRAGACPARARQSGDASPHRRSSAPAC